MEKGGDIIVYNIGFERGKLNDLIDVFPQYSNELSGIVNRLKDLMIPFQQKWYYTPEMRGELFNKIRSTRTGSRTLIQ